VAQVGHELGAELDVDAGDPGEAAGHFGGAVGKASAESVGVCHRVGGQALLAPKTVKVVHSQLQDVRLLQLGDVLPFSLEGGDHQVLQFVQTAVDASSPFALEHGLHHLNKE